MTDDEFWTSTLHLVKSLASHKIVSGKKSNSSGYSFQFVPRTISYGALESCTNFMCIYLQYMSSTVLGTTCVCLPGCALIMGEKKVMAVEITMETTHPAQASTPPHSLTLTVHLSPVYMYPLLCWAPPGYVFQVVAWSGGQRRSWLSLAS